MKPVHPRVLMAALGDLQDSCNEWLIEGRETIANTAAIQRREMQRAQTISRRAAITLTHAQNDRDHVQRVKSDVKKWLSECQASQHRCDDLLKTCQGKEQAAQKTLSYWEDELKQARKWLDWATQRLVQAQAELEEALSEYEHARWAYNKAVDRYNSCVRSKENRNCGSLRGDVNRAEAHLQLAAHRVEQAETELEAAQHEFEHAQARVACCESGVSVAQQAVAIAENAVHRAGQAVAEAERSLDYANAAFKFVTEAEKFVENAVSFAEKMVSHTNKDLQALDTASNAHHRADRFFESAQRLLILSRQELDYRIAALVDFDRTGIL